MQKNCLNCYIDTGGGGGGGGGGADTLFPIGGGGGGGGGMDILGIKKQKKKMRGHNNNGDGCVSQAKNKRGFTRLGQKCRQSSVIKLTPMTSGVAEVVAAVGASHLFGNVVAADCNRL